MLHPRGNVMLRVALPWLLFSGCAEPLLHQVADVREPGRPPALAWGDPPRFAGACRLEIPASAYFDTARGAAYASASGVIEKAAGSVTADASGLAAQITNLTPGPLAVAWTVTDTLGGESTLARNLTLGESLQVVRALPRRPDPSQSERLMDGSQALLGGCVQGCSGTRGMIATGYLHTCAITGGGTLSCWGDNGWGRLGDGTSIDRANPVSVCASGEWDPADRRCENPGDGSPAPALSAVAAVAAGWQHTCALLGDGSVKCWGDNRDGQLGTGDLVGRANPADVCASGTGTGCPLLADLGVVALGAGATHTCAVLANGEVRCWGDNTCGQLGDGAVAGCGVVTRSLNPVAVCDGLPGCNPLAQIVDVVAAASYACALRASGGVACWGRGSEGQLGHGSTTDTATPVDVAVDRAGTRLTNVLALSATFAHTCALTEAGQVTCWGCNQYDCPTAAAQPIPAGALGDGTGTGIRPYAQRVCASGTGAACPPLTGAVAISAGDAFTCALIADGSAKCWGEGGLAQLGSANRDASFLPVTVCPTDASETCDGCGALRLGDLVAISAGGLHTSVLRRDGALFAWGAAGFGQLGNGDTSVSTACAPLRVCGTGSDITCDPTWSAVPPVQACDLYGVTP